MIAQPSWRNATDKFGENLTQHMQAVPYTIVVTTMPGRVTSPTQW